MSISFFIKNLRTDENVSVEKILEIGGTLSQYNLDESAEQIEEFLSEELGNFDCILVGKKKKVQEDLKSLMIKIQNFIK